MRCCALLEKPYDEAVRALSLPDGKRYMALTFGREDYHWYWGFTLVVACLDDGEVYGA